MIEHSDTGAGASALVFIHAFGCDHSDWDAQVAYFSPRHRCIAVDLGGHGATPGHEDHARVETHGSDVVSLMKSLDLPPAIVIGNSLGCRVTMDVSARAPELTRAVILVDGSRLSPSASGVHAALGADSAPEGYQDLARAMFAKMFSPGFDPEKVAEMTERATKVPSQLGVSLLADIGRHDLEEMERLLEEIQIPVMALQSTYITPDGMRHSLVSGQSSPYLDLLREKVRHLSIEIIPNCGHYPQVEYPRETNAAIDAFIARLN
jgi:pimeloyl-ACP methyl ester carboxylesterase